MSFKGVTGEDPLGLILTVGMFFILLFWFGQTNTTINAIGGNTSIVAKYCCSSNSAYGASSWLLWIIFSPFALLIFVNHISRRMDEEGDGNESIVEGQPEPSTGPLLRRTRVRLKHSRFGSQGDAFDEGDES